MLLNNLEKTLKWNCYASNKADVEHLAEIERDVFVTAKKLCRQITAAQTLLQVALDPWSHFHQLGNQREAHPC